MTDRTQDQRVLDVLLRPGWHPMTEFWGLEPTIIHVPRRLANLRERCPGCGARMQEVTPPPEGLRAHYLCTCGATISKRVVQTYPLIEAWRLDYPKRRAGAILDRTATGSVPASAAGGRDRPAPPRRRTACSSGNAREEIKGGLFG